MKWTNEPDGPGYYFVYGRNIDYDHILGPYENESKSKFLLVEYTPEQWLSQQENPAVEHWVSLLSFSYLSSINIVPLEHIEKWWKIPMPKSIPQTRKRSESDRPDQTILNARYPVLSPELIQKLRTFLTKSQDFNVWISENILEEDMDALKSLDDEASSMLGNIDDYIGEANGSVGHALRKSEEHEKKKRKGIK